MSQNIPCAVGIDVAKASLSVCLLYPNGSTDALSIRNTEADITDKLIPALANLTGRVIMEATNYYHWLAALIISEQDYDVRVVNPLTARKYTKSSVRQVKTDPVDATGLAQMARLETNLPPAFKATRQQLVLRKKIGFISSLKVQLQAHSASYKSLAEAKAICREDLSAAEQLSVSLITQLKRQIKQLENEVVTTIAATQSADLERLQTIPGVSQQVAALAPHFFSEPTTNHGKSWIGYAGLDISVRESGTWRGHTRLTKRGHNYLRCRLYSAAWGAFMHDEKFKQYYDQLRERGRSHVEALIIVARKQVRVMASLINHHTVYDEKKSFFQAS